MVSKITIILEVLSDGKWHGIEELEQRLELSAQEVQKITTFLKKYDFAKIDDENGKVKLNGDFQKLLVQTST